jgi:hypothetical protein
MVVYVDVDGVLCTNTNGDYERAEPLQENIDKVNELFRDGDRIVIWTARGTTTGIDWRRLTEAQLQSWGVNYHQLMMNKPEFDLMIDDKSRSAP